MNIYRKVRDEHAGIPVSSYSLGTPAFSFTGLMLLRARETNSSNSREHASAVLYCEHDSTAFAEIVHSRAALSQQRLRLGNGMRG